MTFIRTTLFATTSLFALAACDMEGPNENRNRGAAIGAVVGAAAGATVDDDDRRGALVGAVLGGLAGGAIGAELDRQEAELRRQLEGSGATIQNTGDTLVVTLPNAITFATDSAEIRPGFRNDLAQLASNLVQFPNSIVTITGHTDSVGDAGYNQGLSERRASAVANELVRNGISGTRLRVYGAGETQPVASNDTPEGRAANRRVEVVITPNA